MRMSNGSSRVSGYLITKLPNDPVIKWFFFLWMLSSLLTGAGASTRTLPLQFYRGWWYAKMPPAPETCKIRLTLPYDLPASAHFHILLLPVSGNGEFLGEANQWPKGWTWGKGNPGWTALSHGAVVAFQSGMTMRVSPWVLADPKDPIKVPWGETWPGSGNTYHWQWNEVESRFPYHAVATHAPVAEFRRGSRTSWLNLKALVGSAALPNGTMQVLVALAPYHLPEGGGEEEAFSCFPPKGSPNASALRKRHEGDYPNDPVLLWSTHQQASGTAWRGNWLKGTSKIFGVLNPDMTHTVQFPGAWAASAYQFPLWGNNYKTEAADVSLRRMQGGEEKTIGRLLRLPEGIQGEAMATIFQGSVVKAYYDTFRVLRSVVVDRPIPPSEGDPTPDFDLSDSWEVPPTTELTYKITGLEALDLPVVQWWCNHGGLDDVGAISINGIKLWASKVEVTHPGFKERLSAWLKRSAEAFNAHHWEDGILRLTDMLFLAYIEQLYPPKIFKWQGSDGLLSLIEITVPDFILWLKETPDSSDLFEGVLAQLQEATIEEIIVTNSGGGGTVVNEVAKLRPPLAWATVLPPVFGQLGALASPELTNLGFAWWRASASRMANPATLDALGVDRAKYPWPGWFPVDGAPNDVSAESWWAKYQRVPWARLMKAPSVPPGTSSSDWRYGGTPLAWSERLKDVAHWPSQPPATPASNEGEATSQIVLPTAAYPMGPIEIKFKQ